MKRTIAKVDRTNKTQPNPTEETYSALNQAYEFFNPRLFDSRLPRCMIVMHRKAGSLGYYSAERFEHVRDGNTWDVININPQHIKGLPPEEILGTLVHEMAHQYEFRCVSHKKKRYHDKSWAEIMKQIGLYPSDTGKPGGEETGWRVSHYVVPGGPFDRTCKQLLKTGISLDYSEIPVNGGNKKDESKTKFTCSKCGLNVWGKPDALVDCHICQLPMTAGCSN